MSLLGVVEGKAAPRRDRLFAQNDRNLTATFDQRWKSVATPEGEGVRYALYDREKDPGRDPGRGEAAGPKSCARCAASWSCSGSGPIGSGCGRARFSRAVPARGA